MRGTEYAAADLLTPEVTVAMVAGSSEGLAVASQEIALVVPSLPRPASPSLLFLHPVVRLRLMTWCSNLMPLIDCRS